MRGLHRGFTVLAFGTLALLYAKDSPAPPPPILNCTSGSPSSLVLQYASDIRASINSELPYFPIQALDAAGNPVGGVPITVRAPVSGPSASFVVSNGAGGFTPAPDPLQVTVTTPANCQGAVVWAIANGLAGSYQFTASAPGVAPALLISATNTPAEPPAFVAAQDASTQRIAHTGRMFLPLALVVRGASGLAIAGVPITISLPMSGPSATFADGTTSATVYSDALGKAVAPPLVANSQVGGFYASVGVPGLAPVKVGPFFNAGATQVLLDVARPEPPDGFVDTFFLIMGQTLRLRAWIVFPGLVLPPQADSSFPRPNGRISLRVDGNAIAVAAVDQFYELYVCGDCRGPTLAYDFGLNSAWIGFGQHQVTATYEFDTAYDSSASPPSELRMFANAQLATPYGASLIGATGGSGGNSWACQVESPAWIPAAQVDDAAQPPPYVFPYGLLSYRLDQCAYHGAVFDFPPPLVQTLVIQFPLPLPPGTVFVSYGPLPGDPATQGWYRWEPVSFDGATIRVQIEDGGAGDDGVNGVIWGLSGPALPITPPATVDVVEFYAATLDHYFVSADPQEIAALDNEVIPGWVRTGLGFKAYAADTSVTSGVCRFYIPPQSGDSHFYSASPAECAATKQKFPTLVYESADVFHVGVPDLATGNCAPGTIPVYRVWNNRADSNHRYTTSRSVRDQMIARGYLPEGYGPDGVVMCVAG